MAFIYCVVLLATIALLLDCICSLCKQMQSTFYMYVRLLTIVRCATSLMYVYMYSAMNSDYFCHEISTSRSS